LAFGTFGTTSLAANQIALSLASLTFMFAMECGCHDKSGKSERTYGLCEIAARGAIHILLAILETLLFIVFTNILPLL
jgi:MATE family multidrug resistance protein